MSKEGLSYSPDLALLIFCVPEEVSQLIVACFEEETSTGQCSCGAAHRGPELRGRAAPP